MAQLRWDGRRLMLGTLMVGEVRDANRMHPRASYALAGQTWQTITGAASFDVANLHAKQDCYAAAVTALRDAGVEV